jgi:hypothetical protein
MAVINRAQALSGNNPLAYMGTAGASSNNTVLPLVVYTINPNVNDWQNFSLGTIWLNSTTEQVWFLVSLAGNQATWVEFTAGSSSVTQFVTDNGNALPLAGIINLLASPPAAGQTVKFSGSGNTITFTVSDALNNTLVGNTAGGAVAITTAFGNTGFGTAALYSITTAYENAAVGYNAGSNLNTGGYNSILGSYALNLATTATNNVAVGYSVGKGTMATGITTGSNNTLLGYQAGNAYTSSESNNILIGSNVAGTLGESNVTRIGNSSTTNTYIPGNLNLTNSTTSAATNPQIIFGASNNLISFLFNNVFLGSSAGNNTMTAGMAIFEVGIGPMALNSLTTGAGNTAVGNGAGQQVTTGQENTFYGYVAGNTITTGQYNVGIGPLALITSGVSGVTTGSYNIAIGGPGSGGAYSSSESSNIMISNTGVNGESNVMRIGSGTGTGVQQLNKTFISGIRGITTGSATAIAVLIDTNGQLGTVSSSAKYKDNIEDMGEYSSLLMRLRPVTFNYKKHLPTEISVGLIAEEVDKLIPGLVVYDENAEPETVKYLDLIPMLLNEIQKLNKRIEKLERN